MLGGSLYDKDPAQQLANYRREYDAQSRELVTSVEQLSTGVDRQMAVTASVDRGVSELNDVVGRYLATQDARAVSMLRAIQGLDQHLASIAHSLANPSTTAADEMRRRGQVALHNGWLPDAARDLRAAVSENPYDAVAYFDLARAVDLQNSSPAAALATTPPDAREAASLAGQAAKYAAPTNPSLAATAALFSAEAYRRSSSPAEAQNVLRWFNTTVPGCAITWLALARLSGRVDDLTEAFRIDPTTVVDARVGGLPGAEAAASGALAAWQPLFDEAAAVVAQLNALATDAGAALRLPAMPSPDSGASATLLSRHQWLRQLETAVPDAFTRLRTHLAQDKPRLASEPSEPRRPTKPSVDLEGRSEYQRAVSRQQAWRTMFFVVLATATLLLVIGMSGDGFGGEMVLIGLSLWVGVPLLFLTGSKALNGGPSMDQERGEKYRREAEQQYAKDLAAHQEQRAAHDRQLAETRRANARARTELERIDALERRLDDLQRGVPVQLPRAPVRPLG